MGKVHRQRFGRYPLQRVIFEFAASTGGGDDPLFHAHDLIFVQLGTSFAVGAAGFDVFFKEHGDPFSLIFYYYK